MASGLELPFGIDPVNPVFVDARMGPYTGSDEATAINAAVTSIPEGKRLKGLQIVLYINGVTKNYWFKDGIEDEDLIEQLDTDIAEELLTAKDETLAARDQVLIAETNVGADKIIVLDAKSDTEAIKLSAQNILDAAQNILPTLEAEYEDKKFYDADENEPVLTSDASVGQSGVKLQRYLITVTGLAAFAGSNFDAGDTLYNGDSLVQGVDDLWWRVPKSDDALEISTKLNDKFFPVQVLGHSNFANNSSTTIQYRAIINQQQIVERNAPVVSLKVKMVNTDGNIALIHLRKFVNEGLYKEIDRYTIATTADIVNEIDLTSLEIFALAGDTFALETLTTDNNIGTINVGFGFYNYTVGAVNPIQMSIANVEGSSGNGVACFDVILEADYAQTVDQHEAKINANITNITNAQEDIVVLEATVNTIFVKYTEFLTNGFYQANGTFNSNSSFGNVTIEIEEDKIINYHLYATNGGVGVSIISFFTAGDVFISRITATALQYHTGSVTTPEGTGKAVLCILRAGGSSSYYEIAKPLSPIIEEIQETLANKQDKPTSNLILKVSKTLTPDNITIFSTIGAAYAAWTSGYEIQVFDGTYAELLNNYPDGATSKAIGKVKIDGFLPDNATTVDIDLKSTIDFRNAGIIENFDIDAENVRYPIHSDAGLTNRVQIYRNNNIRHKGNTKAYLWRVANGSVSPNAPSEVWVACSALGIGTQSGSRIYIYNNRIQSVLRAFSTHNNVNFHTQIGNSVVVVEDNIIISEGLAVDGSKLDFEVGVFIQSLASFTDDLVILKNNIIYGELVLQSSSQDWREFTHRIIGSGNSRPLMQIRHTAGGNKAMNYQTTTQNAFILKISSNTANPITVSGNLKDSILLNMSSLTGSTGINSYVKGKVNANTAYTNVNAYSGAKTISFVSGADTKNITLTGGYSTAAQLRDDLNTQFGSNSFVAELYWSGYDWWPEFAEEIKSIRNNGTSAILRGRGVKETGHNTGAKMTDADSTGDCWVALEDIPVGQIGVVKHYGYLLRIWMDGLFSTILTLGDDIKINSDGSFSKATGGVGRLVFKAGKQDNVIIKL